MIPKEKEFFRLRSFVRRDSRITAAQTRAYETLWPRFGLPIDQGEMNNEAVFGRVAPRLLEIGFGSGSSLLALAKSEPTKDFIGVETHKPGMGALLLGMQAEALTNIRLYHGDVVEILQKNIAAASLEGVQIFFPDPWPKRRHHPRRLIQSDFIALVVDKIKIGGTLHLATDWQDYARHMMQVISKETRLFNVAGEQHYANRSPYRPLVTKFEQRALLAGRGIWELQFEKKHIATC